MYVITQDGLVVYFHRRNVTGYNHLALVKRQQISCHYKAKLGQSAKCNFLQGIEHIQVLATQVPKTIIWRSWAFQPS